VFTIFVGDYYRTRLTHTIEVAQIARTVGRNLRLNEDLIEAVALAHDLGHPPFGHAGEEGLNAIMKRKKLKGFNHNKFSFEIVTDLEKRYPYFNGLNLTREVRVGILKHKTAYDVPGEHKDLVGDGPTLEAQVVDIADSLAYLNHDIDDGLTSGYLTEDDLMGSALWRRAFKQMKDTLKTNDREMLKYQIVKSLIDMQVKDFLESSDRLLKAKKINSWKDVIRKKGGIIDFSPTMLRERNELQKLLNDKLYHHYRVERMTSKAKRIIEDLFKAYEENPKQLPYHVYLRNNKFTQKEKWSIICRYIAGMTDRFALEEHKKLFNPYEKV